ncbi:NUDIX domain-containing protein [Glutamicibacter halophytocola]|uniref:Oxidized purine nucleoside triphosphate hydrolase n=2 Tax=Glutamicibacter halophytocola TaxID=1933880 RepID=A0ABX5YE10_9MICC|nr:NUDIX domain-containing protein [Glutamicibacter halophytocola]
MTMSGNSHSSNPRPVALVALLAERDGNAQILLGRKLRGFGQGKIVLPGGKNEPGESSRQAAVREFFEETGLRVSGPDLQLAARIEFRFSSLPAADMDCMTFIARSAEGQAASSDELEPLWFRIDQLPVDQMWQDSKTWLPQLAAGQRFTARIVLASDNISVQTIDFDPWD